MKLRTIAASLLAFALFTTGLLVAAPATATAEAGPLSPQNHTPDGLFQALASPQRFLDTRAGTGGVNSSGAPIGIGGWTGQLGVSQIINVAIAGRLGVPAANVVKAVAMNVTVVDPTGSGFITIWPGLLTRGARWGGKAHLLELTRQPGPAGALSPAAATVDATATATAAPFA